jgi:hypothetical protein
MPEQAPGALQEVSWAQCGCKPCAARRRKQGHRPGCPCPECQPGLGIDYGLNRNNRAKARRERMKDLLQRDLLSPAEEQELEELLHLYTYSG